MSRSSTPTILNIAMLGTGQHRDKVKNMLTSVIDAVDVGPNQSAYLIDGIGAPHKNKKHLMLGTYDLATYYNPETGEFITQKSLKESLRKRATALGGNIRGTGYTDAIKEICTLVENVLRAGKSPLELNLFGFSRGSDTILRAANILFGLYGEAVKVNIFALDPVPGAFRQTSRKACIVPPNVKEYCAILMEDEQRIDFEAQNRSYLVVQNPRKTEVRYLILRGYHSFATQLYEGQLLNNPNNQTKDATILAWDEMRRFAQRHGIKFKDNKKTPPYIVAGGKSGARIYRSTEADPLSDNSRLSAYTRMANRNDQYLQVTRTSKSGKQPIRKAKRQFLSRKFDYFLHGTHCFKDMEHMLLFKQEYPAIFDYFFQNNIAHHGTLKKITDELNKANKDPELKIFLREQAGINVDELLNPSNSLPPPAGIYLDADSFYFTNNELRSLWQGIIEATGSALVRTNSRTRKQEAIDLQLKINDLLIQDSKDADKVSAIKAELEKEALKLQNTKNKNFAYKLATIAGCLDKMDQTVAEQIIRQIKTYANMSVANRLFRNKALLAKKIAIFNTIENCMIELNNSGRGNDIRLINSALNTAFSAAGEVRAALSHRKEGEFEDTLRNLALDLCNHIPIRQPTPQEEATDKVLLQKFHSNMHNNVLRSLRTKKLTIYNNNVQKLEQIINRMLLSQHDIANVDKARKICERLLARLQSFSAKVPNDDSLYTSTQLHIDKLSQLRDKLIKAQNTYQLGKYEPPALIKFSHRSMIVEANPGESLKEKVTEALALTPAEESIGLLSNSAMDTTENFVKNKARINSLSIETGIGLFAKTTMVKSAQFMDGSEYRSDNYFDLSKLSRFGTKGYIIWAITGINDHIHTNPLADKTIRISGNFPDKFVRYATAYCKKLGIPYINKVNDYVPTTSDIKEVEKILDTLHLKTANQELSELNILLRQTPSDTGLAFKA